MKNLFAVFAIALLTTTTVYAKDSTKEAAPQRVPASIGNCASKIKRFSEKLALEFLDIIPNLSSTSVETGNSNNSTVTLEGLEGRRFRKLTLIVKSDNNCKITGVDSPGMDLGN